MPKVNIIEQRFRENIQKIVQDSQERLDVNSDLIKILHGNMTDPLVKKLKADMPQTYQDAIDRLMPINTFKRIMLKMTHIYETGVKRTVEPQNSGDQDAMERYVKQVDMNDEFNYNNLLFNTFGYSLQSIAKDEEGEPYTVSIDNDKFIPVNLSYGRKNRMDLLILLMGSDDDNRQIYWVWTDDQFMIMDSDGQLRTDQMYLVYGEDFEGDMFINPYGTIPYTYVTSSKTTIMPEIAKDDLQIALTLGIDMTDLNYISKFTAFAIIWMIDVDGKNLPVAPNATWNLKSGSGEDISDDGKKPQIGTIKPEGDIDKLISMIVFLLQAYLDSKGVTTSSVGSVNASNYQTGIAKIIDAMDVSDLREKQTKTYIAMEKNYFDKFFHSINPVWVTEDNYQGDKHSYSSESQVVTTFPIQRPVINRKELLEEIKLERELGLSTKERELRRLYPEMSEDDIGELLNEINDLDDEVTPPNTDDLNEDNTEE